jgi:hypothetical protein
MSRTKTFYDLRDALALPGCAICRLAHRAADKYIDALLWELVNDPQARRDIRRAQGFCHAHSWRFVHGGPTLGATIIAHDLLRHAARAVVAGLPDRAPRSLADRVLGRLRPADAGAALGDDLARRLLPEAGCPACEQARITQDIALDTLLEQLDGADGLLVPLQASDGLCLVHLRVLAARSREAVALGRLLAAQAAIWERLADQLAECIRKCDYRFAGEDRGEESGACLRAMAALAGSPPDDTDRETGPVVFPFRGRGRGVG